MSDCYCYTDGASGTYYSGIGYELTGAVEGTDHRTLDGDYTSMEAELHALLEGLRVASMEADTIDTIFVHVDCRPLVKKIRGTEPSRGVWEQYVDAVYWLLNKFDSWELRHCPRHKTKTAHDEARLALKRGRST